MYLMDIQIYIKEKLIFKILIFSKNSLRDLIINKETFEVKHLSKKLINIKMNLKVVVSEIDIDFYFIILNSKKKKVKKSCMNRKIL